MASEQFCLRWNNFQINITSALESLKCDEDLVDVTLTCDGQNVKAHKVILSACSPYFKNVFKENPCQHPVVILKDTHYEDVKALLNFMYQGEVYITQDRLASFLHTAELLQVRGLAGATNPFREQQQQPPPPPRPRKPVPSFSPVTQPTHQLSRCSGASVFTSNFDMEACVNQLSPDNTCVSHPSSPHCDRESSPIPLSKRRKAFPRFTTVHSPISSDRPLSPVESIASPPPSKDTEVISVIKTEPSCDPVTPCELNTSSADRAGIQISSPSEVTECYSNLDEEESSLSEKDDLAADVHSSPPPSHQQQSVLMRSLGGTVPQVQAEDVGRFKCTPIYQRSHWSSMQPCSCHICNKTFSNSFNMKQHIQNVHLPAQMVKCQICRKSFKNKRYLRKHLVTFHGAPLRRIHTQDGQIIHIRERRGGPLLSGPGGGGKQLPPVPQGGTCPHCGQSYSNQSSLKYHVRLMHTDMTNRHCCHLCPRSFALRDVFKEHMWSKHKQKC